MPGAVSQKEMKEGVDKVLDCIETIADDMWDTFYPDTYNENLKQVFKAAFFLEILSTFKKEYDF